MKASGVRRAWAFTVGMVVVVAAAGAGAPAAAGKPGPPPDRPGKPDQLQNWADSEADRPGQRVVVEVVLDTTARGSERAATDAVGGLGGRVTGSVPGHLLQVELPPAAIAAMQRAPGVRSVRRPLPQNYPLDTPAGLGPLLQATIGEEIAHTNAGAWHAAGHSGAGIRIGIVDGFDGFEWDAAAAQGDLPVAPAGTFCRFDGTTCDVWASNVDHGVAVAELIHELAPGAELYVATALSASDLQAAVDWFVANDVTVVNRSLGAPLDGPGDGTGPLNAVVDNAVAAGIAWFNSAGNEAGRNGQHGTYYRAPFTDADGDGWHEFVRPPGGSPMPPGGLAEDLEMACDGILMSSLRWSDWDDIANATDYDLLVFDQQDVADDFDDPGLNPHLISGGANAQGPGPGAGADPLEVLPGHDCTPGSSVYLAINNYAAHNGTAGDTVEIMAEADLAMWSNPGSAGYPIVDSANPGVFGIGAVNADHGIADYSSEGPTNDGRIKPDFTARSGVTTVALPQFHGTSASSPIAAALGALVLAAGHADTPAQLREWLLANATVDAGAVGPDSVYGHGELILPAPDGNPPPPPPETPAIVPVEPARYVDTRGGPTFDGTYTAGGRLPAGFFTKVEVAGFGAVPADALGVAVNLTAINPGGAGHATLFPCPPGEAIDVPKASHVNYAPAETVANNVVVPLGPGGLLCVGTHADTDFVLDVNGYVPAGSTLGLFSPARYLDTRPGAELFDGVSPGGGPIPAETHAEVQIGGRGGVPIDASAAIVSVTAVTPDGAGYVSLYPCSGDPRAASTLNYAPGQVVPNGSIAQLSADGKLCVWTKAAAHLIVDVAGYVPAGTSTLTPRPPERLLDTRVTGRPGDDGVLEVQITGRAGVPADATAAILNVAAVAPSGPGYLTLWPCGPRPTTSNVNYVAGGVRANNTLTKLGPAGTVCIYTKAGSDVILDIAGWVGEPG